MRYGVSTSDNITIVDLFHDSALKYPDHSAVEDEESVITYKELDEMSNHLARRLAEDGFKPGDIAAVKTGRSRYSILAIMGIWKAGGAYVYLDDSYPEIRNNTIIREVNARVVMDEEYFRDHELIKDEVYVNNSEPSGLAVLVYTSGTTSKPKGVMIEHGNIYGLVQNYYRLGFNSKDRLGLFPSLSFVASINDICASLYVGAAIVMIPEYRRRNIELILEFIRTQNITIQFLPPHMARKLMGMDTEDLKLRALLVGSESVRNLKVQKYKIYNVYAASEMCSLISVYEIKTSEHTYPIGTVNPNLKYYITGDDGKPVEKGEEGELWLSGDQVTRGYYNMPELTAEHYISNPFSDEPGYERVYKTGDIVYQDGEDLRYVCRKDNMYKIRGFRVEGGAVEATLLKCGAVKEAAVRAFEDSGGTSVLIGYFTSDEEVDVKVLKERMKEYVPYYMVPTAILQMDELPRNANNKIDRSALKAPAELNDHKLLEEKY